ncbi:MAG TPA: aspartate aminotransferase family protein [Rhodothermales bacterium]|nr:aspartate aminotransferase family protein [Rhodothermales bacterium]
MSTSFAFDADPVLTDDPFAVEDAYTLPTYPKPPVALVRGEGTTVWDVEGNPYLDFYGGHCVALLGHCPPRVVEAVRKQAGELLFYSNAVYSPVRAHAAKTLVGLAPEGLGRVFWCNSGTEANETALKLARATTGRPHVVAMEGGFHGRTLGSLAVTWGDKYHAPYKSALAPTRFVPFGDAAAVRDALAGGDVAAVILEPIQSMAGVVEAEPAYYRALREACDATGTLLLFDEVQTGVGRTGFFLFGEHVGVTPDMATLAKSLGSGVPVGAVLVSEAIAATVKSGDQGTTFGGGMLAMAAVQATLDMLMDEDLMHRAPCLFRRLRNALSSIGGVLDVRGRGALIGVVLDRPAKGVVAALRTHGVIAGGADDPAVVRLMPPLTTTDAEIDRFAGAFAEALRQGT